MLLTISGSREFWEQVRDVAEALASGEADFAETTGGDGNSHAEVAVRWLASDRETGFAWATFPDEGDELNMDAWVGWLDANAAP